MILEQKGTSYELPVSIPDLQFYHSDQPFELEAGGCLPELTIGYHTYGKLNEPKDNVIWVYHALTANSQVADWWAGLFGSDRLFDPEKHFIVCANILGSCYGTTGARSIHPHTGKAYGLDFPKVTIRDMVQAHELLRKHLKIEKIALAVGGSCGGHQVMEYAHHYPDRVEKMALLVTSARETAWAIAIHEAGRMSLEADQSFRENTDEAGAEGLRGARAVGLLGYRTIDAYIQTQTDSDTEKLEDFRASSYVQYQGDKLKRRFYAHCYWHLLKSLDTHNMGRGRGSLEAGLARLQMPSLVIAIDTDMLIPPIQQKFLAQHLPNATYKEIHSDFGHDGFLIETKQINQTIMDWLNEV